MSLVEWNSNFSIKIKSIDDQHKKLFDLLDILFDAMKNENAHGVLSKIIKELIIYTETLF